MKKQRRYVTVEEARFGEGNSLRGKEMSEIVAEARFGEGQARVRRGKSPTGPRHEIVGGKDATVKPTNPKDICGSSKLPVHLWPNTATAMGCIAMLNGMLKYGRSNFRAIGVRASIYYDAAKRHLDAWFEGEECDPDDGVPHLAAALACVAIIVDSMAAGNMTDDRMHKGGYRKMVEQMTPHVARLKELHRDRKPKHYMIADNT